MSGWNKNRGWDSKYEHVCRACQLHAWLNDPQTDLSACNPPALNHTCEKLGPKTKKEILTAIEKAAVDLHHSLSSGMPGGNYHAEEELDDLIWRLSFFGGRERNRQRKLRG